MTMITMTELRAMSLDEAIAFAKNLGYKDSNVGRDNEKWLALISFLRKNGHLILDMEKTNARSLGARDASHTIESRRDTSTSYEITECESLEHLSKFLVELQHLQSVSKNDLVATLESLLESTHRSRASQLSNDIRGFEAFENCDAACRWLRRAVFYQFFEHRSDLKEFAKEILKNPNTTAYDYNILAKCVEYALSYKPTRIKSPASGKKEPKKRAMKHLEVFLRD